MTDNSDGGVYGTLHLSEEGKERRAKAAQEQERVKQQLRIAEEQRRKHPPRRIPGKPQPDYHRVTESAAVKLGTFNKAGVAEVRGRKRKHNVQSAFKAQLMEKLSDQQLSQLKKLRDYDD